MRCQTVPCARPTGDGCFGQCGEAEPYIACTFLLNVYWIYRVRELWTPKVRRKVSIIVEKQQGLNDNRYNHFQHINQFSTALISESTVLHNDADFV
jgi:hypothetical protein